MRKPLEMTPRAERFVAQWRAVVWSGPDEPVPDDVGPYQVIFSTARQMMGRAVGLRDGEVFPPFTELLARTQALPDRDLAYRDGGSAIEMLREVGLLRDPD